MAEYICREALIKELEADFNTDWADYASKNNFDKDYIDGVRDEYDDTLRIICQQKTADVQPLSVVAEHIKNRLYETALNTDEAVARDAIADMAERVDWWINELKECEQSG